MIANRYVSVNPGLSITSLLLVACIFHSCRVESLHQQGQASSSPSCYKIARDHAVSSTRLVRTAFVSPMVIERDIFKTRRSHPSTTSTRTTDFPDAGSIISMALAANARNGRIEDSRTIPSDRRKQQINHYHLTILIPAYNERYRIGDTLSSYINCLIQTPVYQHQLISEGSTSITSGSVSILVVDDGSTDGTADYIQQNTWLSTTPTVKKENDKRKNCWNVDGNVACISLPENAGKGAAIERGMAELPSPSSEDVSKGVRSIVLVADADGSGDISCIDGMLQRLEELLSAEANYLIAEQKAAFDPPQALVVGYRQYSESKSPLRSLLSWGFRTCVSLIFLGTDLGVRDTQCGFKLMTTSAGKRLYHRLHLRRWTHDVEVLHRARLLGCPLGECGVNWVDKEGSKLVQQASDAVVVSSIMLSEIALMRTLYTLGVWSVDGGEK